MKENLKNPMLFHEDLPVLIDYATLLKKEINEYQTTRWIPWQSKQYLPKSWLSAEETQGAVLALDPQLKSLPSSKRSSVRRGDFRVTDALVDDFLKVLRQELADVTAYKASNGNSVAMVSASGGGIAAASAAAGALTTVSPRKRSCSSMNKDASETKLAKGAEGTRAGLFSRLASRPAIAERGHSSAPMDDSTASIKELSSRQMNKLIDWMKGNGFNTSPSWSAFDHLVEITGAKPSQVVAFIQVTGGVVAKNSNNVKKNHENDVDDSVPELAEDKQEDAWNGFVADDEAADFPAAMSRPEVGVVDDIDHDSLNCIDSVDLMIMELGVELEDSGSWDSIQDVSSVLGGKLVDSEAEALFDVLDLDLDHDLDCLDDDDLQRPSKRARSDSLDSLLFGSLD